MVDPHANLRGLLESRRVIITVGAGGVGKTTTAAALGLAAAKHGKRVLCLTIDPAKRLAESLGMREVTTDAVTISPERFAAAGIAMKGTLTVAMVDTKRTFDELILRYSSTAEKAQRLLSNRLYQYVSTSLAGTQEYMAMEKLIAVENSPDYDLIVLDTPPTANALDFLDAPQKLIDVLDSSALRWFVEAFESSGKVSLNLLARSAAVVLRGMGKITGGGFLESMAEFINELNELFGGFKQRAAALRAILRRADVAFVLVTSPAPMSIQEVLYFSDRLEEHGLPRGAFVVNRVRMPPAGVSGAGGDAPPSTADIAAAIHDRGLALGAGAPERVLEAFLQQRQLALLDASNVAALAPRVGGGIPIVRVPELATDVHDLARLAQVATLLEGS